MSNFKQGSAGLLQIRPRLKQVHVVIGASRYDETLTPDEARKYAANLIISADEAEAEAQDRFGEVAA
jgi:hypothetical protein